MLFLSLNLLKLINKCYCISINVFKLINKCYYILKCIDLGIDDSIYYIIQLIVK